MMDIETIVALNKEAGNKAKRHGMKPTTFDEDARMCLEDGNIEPIRSINKLGNYVPKGWKRFNTNNFVDEWALPYSHKLLENGGLFVDSSGFGSSSEPALTIGELVELMNVLLKNRPDLGFSIVSEGQFQLTIGVFECQN